MAELIIIAVCLMLLWHFRYNILSIILIIFVGLVAFYALQKGAGLLFVYIKAHQDIIFLMALSCLALKFGPGIIRHIRKKRYFASEDFLSCKKEIASFVSEHNEVSEYVQMIRSNGDFNIGSSNTGKHSHLASSENTSEHKYKRDRNVSEASSPNVHNW